MKEQITENKPATVGRAGESLNFPKQAGEPRARWAWVERSIWTERMLERLAQSQEQTVWFSLWDKVCNPDNLDAAILGVIKNRGNLYLNPLDHLMAGKGFEMVRYADDMVVCAKTETEAYQALQAIGAWTQAAALTLHATKTRILNAAEKGGFDFLGYHFEQYREGGGKKWPRQKSQQKLREGLRAKLARSRSGSHGQIMREINPILRGWYGYFKYSLPSAMQRVDEWVRERTRHILRRRHKRRGMVKGRERTEYGISWFAEQGLFSLKEAQAKLFQSPTGNH